MLKFGVCFLQMAEFSFNLSDNSVTKVKGASHIADPSWHILMSEVPSELCTNWELAKLKLVVRDRWGAIADHSFVIQSAVIKLSAFERTTLTDNTYSIASRQLTHPVNDETTQSTRVRRWAFNVRSLAPSRFGVDRQLVTGFSFRPLTLVLIFLPKCQLAPKKATGMALSLLESSSVRNATTCSTQRKIGRTGTSYTRWVDRIALFFRLITLVFGLFSTF